MTRAFSLQNLFKAFILILTSLLLLLTSFAEELPPSFNEKRYSLKMSGAKVSDALTLIGKHASVSIEFNSAMDPSVSYNFQSSTLQEVLDTITNDNELSYKYKSRTLFVYKNAKGGKNGAGGDTEKQVFKIPIQYGSVKELTGKIPSFATEGEKLVPDDASNSLVFYGSEVSYLRIKNFIEALDALPKQIMIEAQIVETSKTFLRNFGFQWGNQGETADNAKALPKMGFSANNGNISSPTGTFNYLLGWLDGHALEARLSAAENAGEAKILSRPKVVTLNNESADIQSGITYNIKTVTVSDPASGGGSGGSGGTGGSTGFTTGIQQISAGLNLRVLPTIVGDKMIRLKINVSNSEPDKGLEVDGIPGIVDNSAQTSIIVANGNTVTMAGLIKQTTGHSENRTPGLASVPVLGWLFRSDSRDSRDRELVIFITPKIIDTSKMMPREAQRN